MADVLRRWGKGRTGAEKLSSPVVKPEAPFLPAGVYVPYESVVDADIPEGYTPQPVTLGKPESSNPTAKQPEACCGNSCNRNATGDDAAQAAVCESMRLLADKCPVEHLAAAVQRMAANSDGVVLFPARVISRLAATVLAMSKNIGTN